MKQKLEKDVKQQSFLFTTTRVLKDRFMTEMDLKGEWGVPPADGCLGRSSALLWVMAASAITHQLTEPRRRRALQMFALYTVSAQEHRPDEQSLN